MKQSNAASAGYGEVLLISTAAWEGPVWPQDQNIHLKKEKNPISITLTTA